MTNRVVVQRHGEVRGQAIVIMMTTTDSTKRMMLIASLFGIGGFYDRRMQSLVLHRSDHR